MNKKISGICLKNLAMQLIKLRGFGVKTLDKQTIAVLERLGTLARGDILKMTTLAESGHPGGSLSSVDIYLILYSSANIDPKNPYSPDRDRIIVSHGHTSPAAYAVLGRLSFFEVNVAISTYRRINSVFEGHVDKAVPGIEWTTGNLGQGLSVGCSFALANKLKGKENQIFIAMSDGEQTKGQVAEARRFAKKYKLNNITVIIDYNGFQINGPIYEVMPQHIKENYLADGWKVLEIDGHNFQDIYRALREAVETRDIPVAILAHTVLGKGVSFMENKVEFHGKPLLREQCQLALSELGLKDDLEYYLSQHNKIGRISYKERPVETVHLDVGSPHTYTKEDKLDNRTAFGEVMKDLAKLNCARRYSSSIAVLDCDLANSVRTDGFANVCPKNFFQAGVQEHNAATIAGTLSTQGILTFFADYGVFGIDETYNQHRLNDINNTNLKLVCTHCGLDVGPDGKTHQCIDYIGIINNLYGYKIIIPADPNHTDRVIRYIALQPGNFLIGMGRSKLPIILTKEGKPFFGKAYRFQYGKIDVVRKGDQATIIAMGNMLHRAIEAWEKLAEKNYRVRILNLSCLSEVDTKVIKEGAETGIIVTYEDHNIKTGMGNIVANVIAENSLRVRFVKMGITAYGTSGKPKELFKAQGLDINTLIGVVVEEIEKNKLGSKCRFR